MSKDNKDGYIAIVSAIIFMTVLLLMASASSMTGFYSRFNALDRESKKHGLILAESCGEQALLKLAINSGYLGNETIGINSDSCKICAVTTSGQQRIFNTKAVYNQTVSNLAINLTLNPTSLAINSWQEIPTNNSC